MTKFHTMGVINITPNSFSDGNQYNNKETFTVKFNKACFDFDIIDLGAESTAPFNNAIGVDEELARFKEIFYPLLQSSEDPSTVISIDTYKVEVFAEICNMINQNWPKSKVIFNDVSGCIDQDLIDLLGGDLQFDYVFSHNLSPAREHTSEHMNYCVAGECVQNMIDFFTDNLKTLNQFNRHIYIDPCFGFSKTREQNHIILNNLGSIINSVPGDYSVLVGISRKSFLRFPREMDAKNVKNQKFLESLSALFYQKIIDEVQRPLVFRVHELSALKAVIKFNEISSNIAT